jgi:hypothetical protein
MHNEDLKHEKDLLQEVEKFSLEELISHMPTLRTKATASFQESFTPAP